MQTIAETASSLSSSPSCRWDIKDSLIEKYYLKNETRAVYGVYLSSLDRFLFLDRLDLNATLHAAKLLSGKMSLTTYVLPQKNDMTSEDSLSWVLRAKNKIRLSEIDKPRLLLIEDGDEIRKIGEPKDIEMDTVLRHREYALFVLRVTYAMRLTDALCNSTEHPFYMKFFPDIASNLGYQSDDSHWPNGFIFNIEKILYLSNSVDEVLQKFSKLLPLSSYVKKNPFALTFYDLLGWRPQL